jgi:alkyl sulfatase BDS1-like metallo-beta-lactamase superfamily hydrolase
MGGRDAVVAAAERAHADRDFRWVAELLTHVLRVDPGDQRARQLKADSLRQLGYRAANPMWRNNYLTAAREIDGTLDRTGLLGTMRALGNPDVAATMPISLLLRTFATRLDPSRSEWIQLSVSFVSANTDASYGLAIRSEVAEVLAGAPLDATLAIEATDPTLRGLLTGRSSWSRAVEEGAATLTLGTAEEAARFWSLFDPPSGELPALALR